MSHMSLRDEIISSSSAQRGANGQKHASGRFNQPSSDITSANYDPLVDIFELFDDPSALNDVDHLLKYSHAYQMKLEEEINVQRLDYTRVLTESGSNQGIDHLDDQVVQLLESFQNLKGLAEYTGSTITSMTSSIKTLDHSKKNLTFTMTTLKRLQMLVTAYDRLEKQLEREKRIKNYLEIKQLLSAVLELNKYFQDFKSIDEVNKLNKLISSMKNKIINDIFSDFDAEYNEELVNDQLTEACHILEALGETHREELETWYVNAVLKDITEIFRSTEEAGSLDNISRRYIYFQNILTNFEAKHLKVFPKSWKMSLIVTERFCAYTKADLKEVLSKEFRLKNATDVNTLLGALSHTLDFETYLNKKFKYYKDFDEQLKSSEPLNFNKSISDVFEPYLNIWIDNQSTVIEKKLAEFTNPSNMFKKTGDGISDKEEDSNKKGDESLNVLESAADLFRLYRQLLAQLSKLTTGKSLIRLSKIFSKYLTQYQHKILDTILPDSKALVSVDLKSQQEGIDIICLVLNTASYCSTTVGQLEEKMRAIIEPSDLAGRIEFEAVNNGFLQLIAYCINLAFYKIENDIQLSWRELANFNWLVLNDVTGESRYVTSLKSIIKEDCVLIFGKIGKVIYVRNLIDKILEMLLNNILINIVKLEPISTIMAEQFKLDLQELKSFINLLPTLADGGDKILASASFKSNINTKFKNIDNLMKILMVSNKPMDVFINSYFSIIGDSNFSNFIKILQLKGVVKSETTEKDKFKYMDMFKLQLSSFENENASDDGAIALKESDVFLEKLNVTNTTSTNVRRTHGHSKSNSRSIYLPSTVLGGSGANLVSPLPPAPPTPARPSAEAENVTMATSPKGNFGFFTSPKTDTNSFHMDKGLTKTFVEKQTTFNENFKKFFKRGD